MYTCMLSPNASSECVTFYLLVFLDLFGSNLGVPISSAEPGVVTLHSFIHVYTIFLQFVHCSEWFSAGSGFLSLHHFLQVLAIFMHSVHYSEWFSAGSGVAHSVYAMSRMFFFYIWCYFSLVFNCRPISSICTLFPDSRF